MQLTNEWIEKGKLEGRREGRREGQRSLIVRQLRRRFGRVPADFNRGLVALPDSQIDRLGESIFDFKVPGDAVRWLKRHSTQSGRRPK